MIRRLQTPLCLGIICLTSFHQCHALLPPTEDDVQLYDKLYQESLEKIIPTMLSSKWNNPYDIETFRQLAIQGPRLIGYLVLVKSRETLVDEQDSRYNSLEYMANKKLCSMLWCVGFRSPLLSQSSLWRTEPWPNKWKGGRTLANVRTSFILSEWRYAKNSGHAADERVALHTLRSLGIQAYEVLFQELENEAKDVLEVFAFINSLDHFWHATDRESLLDWWDEHREEYLLPETDPDFPLSELRLDEWKRLNL